MKKRCRRSPEPKYAGPGTTFTIHVPADQVIRLGVLSDMHSGHYLGLTPPDYFRPLDAEDPDIRTLAIGQRERYDAYRQLIRAAGPVHHLHVNGDSIDGNGFRLDGAEMVCESHDQMAAMAAHCIKEWVTPGVTRTIHMIGGTPSHTWFGPIDVEKLVRDSVVTKCPSVTYNQSAITEFSFGNGRVFRILQRHDTPKGSIQAGGAGPGAIRQSVKLDLEALYNGHPLVDLMIFSHAHEAYYGVQPLAGRNKHIIVTPCLQGSGSVYGQTKCAGVITWGITVIELRLVNGEIQFSQKFLTRNLTANRPIVNHVVYDNAKS